MNEESKIIDEANSSVDILTNNEVVNEVPVIPVETVEPVPVIQTTSEEVNEPVPQVNNVQPEENVEVLDIDLNREKPTVIAEQVVDKETEKKQQNKTSIVLVIILLLIVALAVIFIPQISSVFK